MSCSFASSFSHLAFDFKGFVVRVKSSGGRLLGFARVQGLVSVPASGGAGLLLGD